MYRVQFLHPTLGSCVTRYFKSVSNIEKFFSKFHCPITFSILSVDLDNEEFFHIGSDGLFWSAVPSEVFND